MGVGKYSDRVRVLDYDPTTNEDNGQAVPNWTASSVYYWCSIEETNGRKQENYGGAVRTGADATIAVNGYPTIDPRAHLLDQFGTRWVIETVHQGDNEMVVEAYRFDSEVPLPGGE